MKRIFRLAHDQARKLAAEFLARAPDGWMVTFSEPTRNLEQNDAQFRILRAFSNQIQWPVNGRMESLTPEEWKDLLTAAFRQQQPRIAQGIDGGMVLLGQRTSKFSVREFSDYLEFLHSVAADRGVVLGEVK